MMNKKGDEKYLSPWNFVIWGLIIITISAGILVFNSTESDVRSTEARILSLKVIDCIIDDSILQEDSLLEDNFYSSCSLSKEIIEDSHFYLIKISAIELESKVEYLPTLTLGNPELEVQCALKKDEKKFAECYYNEIYTNSISGTPLIVKITTSSNNLGDEL